MTLRVPKGKKQSFSISVAVIGIMFTSVHGYLNARWFSEHAHHLESNAWLSSPWFMIGYPVYEVSYWMTIYHESIIRNLRSSKQKKEEESVPHYKIPYGGAFAFVTNPQYFFELLGWAAWAMCTANPGGLVVFAVSSANLVPRAFSQHKWYQTKFEDYPKERKVLVPFVV